MSEPATCKWCGAPCIDLQQNWATYACGSDYYRTRTRVEYRWERGAKCCEKELAALRSHADAMAEALAYSLFFREFSDEWHNSENREVVEFRKLRLGALSAYRDMKGQTDAR